MLVWPGSVTQKELRMGKDQKFLILGILALRVLFWVCGKDDVVAEHHSVQMVLPHELDLAQQYTPAPGHTGDEAGPGWEFRF